MKALKQQIWEKCNAVLREKESQLLAELAEITEARDMETKSTAGDKHETARAHMQTRQAQLELQLSELKQKIAGLEKVSITQARRDQVMPGSLVLTSQGYFLIAAALGKIEAAGLAVFVISPKSPVGSVLTGLKSGAEFSLNGTKYQIEEIW